MKKDQEQYAEPDFAFLNSIPPELRDKIDGEIEEKVTARLQVEIDGLREELRNYILNGDQAESEVPSSPTRKKGVKLSDPRYPPYYHQYGKHPYPPPHPYHHPHHPYGGYPPYGHPAQPYPYGYPHPPHFYKYGHVVTPDGEEKPGKKAVQQVPYYPPHAYYDPALGPPPAIGKVTVKPKQWKS
uniref:Uncharacterized protein n=1 Tax=Strombidium inclinatum TaxID=197538 RepID=A0A7S3IGB7_9SPIT|mmetsp:Transcript_15791/g.24306  ORF Transcript_15791/g.24306 Transcript_15791/m.24306 type:complete len:184 (+) Transcript_15791:9-560(+)